MDKEEVGRKVEQFISDRFVFEESQKPGMDDSLLDTGTIDSVGILELVSFLEEAFSVSVKDEELVPANLDSINKIVGYVERKLTGTPIKCC